MKVFRNAGMTAFAATLLATASTGAHAEATTIKISLWDKGADKEMVMDQGYGSSADHSMANMGIKLSSETVKAGQVTFEVTNEAKELEHEMLVLPLKNGMAIPYKDQENKLDEDAAGSIGEVAETEPGKTGSATFDLAPGKYLLSCNIAGHYKNGMWAVLTVE